MEACYSEIPRVHQGELDLISEAEVETIVNATKALSDPIRLQMLHLLSQREDLCTCEFEELLGLSQSKVSYHLNLLLQARFVTRENRGTWSHYRLRDSNMLNQVRTLAGEPQARTDVLPL